MRITEQTGMQCLVIRAECACVIVNAEILKNRREPPMEDQPRYIKFLALLFLVNIIERNDYMIIVFQTTNTVQWFPT